MKRHRRVLLGHGRAAVPWLIDDISLPAVLDEVLGPALTPVRGAHKASTRRAATVNEHKGRFVDWLYGNEVLNVHRKWLRTDKEVAFCERHRMICCGASRHYRGRCK